MYIYIVSTTKGDTLEILGCWSCETDAKEFSKKYPDTKIDKIRLNSDRFNE
tara:strand:- start:278 stop:430 length:153 start_codon:yes stop_codon:yes gene_type:complete